MATKPDAATIDTTAVVVHDNRSDDRQITRARAEDFLPLLSVEQAVQRKTAMNAYISKVLLEDVDYGKQPGGGQQKVLKKSGAEKLCSVFGLSPRIVAAVEVEDWTGADHGGEPFFYYKYTIGLYRGDMYMGEAVGSCNSWESKYRYRWIGEDEAKLQGLDVSRLRKRGGRRTIFEPDFALDKCETTGKYGKPAEYWNMFRGAVEAKEAKRTKKLMGKREYTGWEIERDETQYRIPNPDAADVVNTVQKMAYKRALVAPVLVVTNCSDAFTQDLDEDEDTHAGGSTGPQEAPPPPPTDEEHGASQPANGAPQAPAGQTSANPQPAAEEMRTPTTKRLVPVELQGIIKRLMSQPTKKNIDEAAGLLERFLIERYGKDKGVDEYNRILAAFDTTIPKAQRTVGDYVEFFMDLWEAADVAKPSVPKG